MLHHSFSLSPKVAGNKYPEGFGKLGSLEQSTDALPTNAKSIREQLSVILEDRTPSPVQRSAMAVLAAHDKWAAAEMKRDAEY